jgi:hypothetical protein
MSISADRVDLFVKPPFQCVEWGKPETILRKLASDKPIPFFYDSI